MSDFWSRRKSAVEKELAADEAAELAKEQAAAEAVMEARSDEELLTEAGLPIPEEIDTPEQVQAFLKTALPQRLKTRALRRLWTLNPIFANLDGLVDYGEDYTDAATVVENMQTVYQVGKGMFDKFAEPDPSEIAEDEQDEAGEPEPEEPVDNLRPVAPMDDAALAAVSENTHEFPPEQDIAELAPNARRMRFQFEDAG